MIRYQYITRQEAVEWQARTPLDPHDPLTDFRLSDHQRSDPDELVAVIATNDGKVIGRNFLFHCPILVGGNSVDCIISHNLFVAPEYRPKGIGTYVKMYVLKLGYPQISSGVSPAMQKVQDTWRAYAKIDSTPAFAIPVDALGMLRVARLVSSAPSDDSPKDGSTIRSMMQQLRARAGLAWPVNRHLSAYPGRQAAELLDQVLEAERFPVQIPWNRDLIRTQLLNDKGNPKAWVVSVPTSSTGTTHYLITGYLIPRTTRTLGTRTTKITELHINEIFPPVRDAVTAALLLGFAAQKGRKIGASIVQLYATTKALKLACIEGGLRSFHSKHVYIAPNTNNPKALELLRDPSNWWCRAINETQFEEIALARPAPRTDFAFLDRTP